ncbi:helix-turn-helix domain-containing protein [Streptomyces sp. NPDC058486]|uniref:helix-turn-helix domain-containing protein n=1 Tax=unclassified Streptomyces TaxID=2593676 RepID=UPI00364F331D
MGAQGTAQGPAARMQIARGLRQLMEAQSLTQTSIAREAGVSVDTVNRYLAWEDRGLLKIPTLRAIAAAAGATPGQTDILVALAQTQGQGWWRENSEAVPWLSPLHAFEEVAEYEYVWATTLVPGLA